ncbi:hypothetical protein AK812_SmicGene8829 [Symbiodinium microadriaticum]|uniref:S1 motif domain-containing protein n=1 Tax=Symbiodinium microadriaticum TaxID=2951 RepID=A0A1Q9EK33_SYMMI|nr:hypothetical protein AK812_SmicGene8829 [Symbiodinium microadriaticum]
MRSPMSASVPFRGASLLQLSSVLREPKGPEVKKSGRCWASRSRSSPAQAVEGTEKGRQSGAEVGGVILHSTWLGAFVNIGAEIDGFIEVQDLPPQRKLSAEPMERMVFPCFDLDYHGAFSLFALLLTNHVESDGAKAFERLVHLHSQAGDFVTGLVVREVDLSAPRLLLSAVQAKVHEA